MTPKPSPTFALAGILAAIALNACGASPSSSKTPNDPLAEESPGNPGAVSTVNEYTEPSLGGSWGVAGDPPMGNPALAHRVGTTTVTSAPLVAPRKPAPSAGSPTDIGATGGAGTVSGGAGGSTGTDAPVP